MEEESRVPHALECDWVMWHRKNELEYHKNEVQAMPKMSTLEDFASVHNFLRSPKELANRHDYCIFKHGVCPDWEDAANAKGGTWTVDVAKHATEAAWEAVLFFLVGTVGKQGVVTGAVVRVRKGKDKVSIWVSDHSDMGEVTRVGNDLRRVLAEAGVDVYSAAYTVHGARDAMCTIPDRGKWSKTRFTKRSF